MICPTILGVLEVVQVGQIGKGWVVCGGEEKEVLGILFDRFGVFTAGEILLFLKKIKVADLMKNHYLYCDLQFFQRLDSYALSTID